MFPRQKGSIRLWGQQRKELGDILFAEGHLVIIYDQAGNAHHLILIFKLLKMADIIHMGGDIGVRRGDPLGGNHQIRTHGA